MVVKAKVAIFIVAAIVLALNLFLLLDRIFSFLGFLIVLFLIAVVANASFSLIDRRRKSNWKKDKSTK